MTVTTSHRTADTTAAPDTATIASGRDRRRTARVLGTAVVGLALCAGVVGCGATGDQAATDPITATVASTGTSLDPATEVEVVDSPLGATSTDAPSTAGAPSAGGQGRPAGTSAVAPVISSFWTPDDIDCHNGAFQQFTATWATAGAVEATISIDGPGVYATYPASGETSLPFNCSSPHTFVLTAHGADGATAQRSVTLHPRNVQTSPDDEQPQGAPGGTTAKISGGSTGSGPASQRDCEILAQQQDTLIDIGAEALAGGGSAGYDKAIEAADEASAIADMGESLGCFFVYT